MTIGPITSTPPQAQSPATQVPYTKYDTKAWRDRFTDAFDAIAAKLGMSKSDLIGALQSGQKMKDIEAAKGVSKDDVIAAAAGALKQDDPALSATQANQLATQYYDGKVGHRHHHHHASGDQKLTGLPVQGAGSTNDPTQPAQPVNNVDVLS